MLITLKTKGLTNLLHSSFVKKTAQSIQKQDQIHEVHCFSGSCLHLICKATNAKHIVNWSLFILKTIKTCWEMITSKYAKHSSVLTSTTITSKVFWIFIYFSCLTNFFFMKRSNFSYFLQMYVYTAWYSSFMTGWTTMI